MFELVRRLRRDYAAVKQTKYHRDCSACCAINRCHWCLTRIGDGSIVGTKRMHKGLTYRICGRHAARFDTDPHSPFGGMREAEFTVIPVVLR